MLCFQDNSLGDVEVNMTLEESGIVVEDGGTLGGVATGKDALTLLDNVSTRAAFLDQLMEVCDTGHDTFIELLNMQNK